MYNKYPNCCTSCSFQLKNFDSIHFLHSRLTSTSYLPASEIRIKYRSITIRKIKYTFGFGMISIFSASASTSLLIAFKLTHLCEILLAFNQCLLIALRPTWLTNCLCWKFWTSLLTWIHWPVSKKPLHVNHKLAEDIFTQILDYDNLIIAKSTSLG